MMNRQPNTPNRSYEYSSFPILGILGTLLLATGALSTVALLMKGDGAFLGSIRTVVVGLGGVLALGIPIVLIWSGVLLLLSNGRKMPFRPFLLSTLLYLIMLALFNLLSRIGEEGFFVDYCNARQMNLVGQSSFGGALNEAFHFCANYGEPAGALGMLFAWPAHAALGTAFGTVVLGILFIVILMWLFRFNLSARLADWRAAADVRRQEREQMRAQQEEQNRRWAQQRQMEQNMQPPPSFGGRNAQQPMQPFPAQPMGDNSNTRPPLLTANTNAVATPSMSSLHASKSIVHSTPKPDVELYDEKLDETSGHKSWKPAHKPMKAQQSRKTFAPSDSAKPEETVATKAEMEENAAGISGDRRNTIAQLEENRKRKAELFMQAMQSETKPEEEPVAVPADDPQKQAADAGSNDMPEIPAKPELIIPEPEEFFPLLPEDADDSEDNDESDMGQIPEDPKQHTHMFAPLQGMGETAPEEPKKVKKPYVSPPVSLLNLEERAAKDFSQQDQENAEKIESTLKSFNIAAKVRHITHGPSITRFALGLLQKGVNVKRIQGVADNLKLELSAVGPLRIENQIPGTSLFGIEVPNREVQPVTFAQVLLSPEMQQSTSPLAVGLGHDITGKPIICDLSKMPHLLIAGQTGSGKSVCVNTIINSLLFRTSPEDVRLIMIDPKVVELQCYNVVPHLLIPVVSEPHKATGALAWAVAEMEDRYKKMQLKNVRELNAYNAKLEPGETKLPRIVIIIDELADLMMASKREVEESIIRLAQKARAAGIHMVVATQRPTVDVITGLIKSNVPSRIAFAVSSSVDSRTILDQPGADKLLGKGDMLYFPTGMSAPVRVQGCFLSDPEIERIVDFIGENCHAEFDPDVLEALERQEEDHSDALDDGGSDGSVDELLEDAIDMVLTDGQASISMLQRRLKVGYARAGRLIDDMASRGIVSKSLGSKPREVLISREEYERIKSALLE